VRGQAFYIWDKISKGEDWVTWVPDSTNKTLNIEYVIFRESLLIHRKFLQLRDLPELQRPTDLIKGCLTLGPKWASAQKKTFDYSIRETISLSRIQTPDEVVTYHLEDIDHLFPSRSYIPFEFEEDYSDARYSLEEPPAITGDISKLEDLLFEFFKKDQNLREFDDLDSITLMSKKKGMDKLYGPTVPSHKLRKALPNEVCESDMRFVISQTTKSPDEVRVIAVADVPTKNLLHIGRLMTESVNNCPSDSYGKPRWGFTKKLKMNINKYFIMVDQSKSGWTFPMELMESYFKVLHRIYPDYHNWTILEDIFRNKSIYFRFGDSWCKTKRGFVLGMWDNVMSYIISCIFEGFKRSLIERGFVGPKDLEGQFWGDDQLITLSNGTLEQAYQVWNRWIGLLLSYGININRKKSFVSDKGVFCEVYTDNCDIPLEKAVIYAMMPFNALRGQNITECKSLWASFDDLIARTLPYFTHVGKEITALSAEALERTMSAIGLEFDHDEVLLPYNLGGWRYVRDEEGKSALLQYILNEEIHPRWCRVGCITAKKQFSHRHYNACQEVLDQPYMKVIQETLQVSVGGHNLFETLKNHIFDMPFEGVAQQTDTSRFWQRFYTARQTAYKSKEWASKKSLLVHLYEDKAFRNAPIYMDLLVKRPSETVSSWVQVPEHKEEFRELDPMRACCLAFKKILKQDFLGVRFLREDKYSISDLIACIFPISRFNTTVPEDWYEWCTAQGRDLKILYKEFKSRYNCNIFDFYPPFKLSGDNFDYTDITPYRSWYWDEYYGYFFPVDDDEMFILSSFILRMERACRETGLSDVEYYHHSIIRNEKFKPPDPEEETLEQDLALLKALMEAHPPVAQLSENTAHAVVTDIDALLALEAELGLGSDEEESPPHHEDLGDWLQQLVDQGLDTIDLLDLGAQMPD